MTLARIDDGKKSQPIPALVDSGADRTVIPLAMAEELALPQAGVIEAAGLNQITSIMPVYVAWIAIGDMAPVAADVMAAAGEQYVLLGRDILNGYRVMLDGPGLLCTIEMP